jgi:hypothetical protein
METYNNQRRRRPCEPPVRLDTNADPPPSAPPLSGEQIVHAVCDHLQVGQEAHYGVIYEVLATG